MIILVGSKVDQSSIRNSLGKPEYSYYFLLKEFLPALERVGRVVQVQSPEEVEVLSAQYRAVGEEVVFFSFSPPHQVPLGASCPTVVVFAWEFDSLPSFEWGGNPQNDWRYTFAHIHGAICTSAETAGLVETAMPDFPVMALPAPVWDRYGDLAVDAPAALDERQFRFEGVVIDSPILGLSADGLVRKPVESSPELVSMPVASVPSPGRLAEAWLVSKALLRGWWQECRLPLKAAVPQAEATEENVEEEVAESIHQSASHLITVSGVVYTTVLNPADGRKNWVDLVTAFCWAFKNVEDATLIVKMTHHDLQFYRVVLMTLLSRLAPFRCRVIVLHGFLDDEQYRQLMSITTYYINSSAGEGLCLPLMEFLSAGKPAIAPFHTAMADYVDDRLAFPLKSSPEPFCWPHDPTGVYATHRHRLNWQSLMEAYRESHEVALHDSPRYRDMARHACERMQSFASVTTVASPLGAFLEGIVGGSQAAVSSQKDSVAI